MGTHLSTAIIEIIAPHIPTAHKRNDAVGYELIAIFFDYDGKTFIACQSEKRAISVIKRCRPAAALANTSLSSNVRSEDIQFHCLDFSKLFSRSYENTETSNMRVHVIFDPAEKNDKQTEMPSMLNRQLQLATSRLGHHMIRELILPSLTGNVTELEQTFSNVHTVWNSSRVIGLRASSENKSNNPEHGFDNPLIKYAFTRSGEWFTANQFPVDNSPDDDRFDSMQKAIQNFISPDQGRLYLFAGFTTHASMNGF